MEHPSQLQSHIHVLETLAQACILWRWDVEVCEKPAQGLSVRGRDVLDRFHPVLQKQLTTLHIICIESPKAPHGILNLVT